MQNSALYDPRANATPSQLRAAALHHARNERLGSPSLPGGSYADPAAEISRLKQTIIVLQRASAESERIIASLNSVIAEKSLENKILRGEPGSRIAVPIIQNAAAMHFNVSREDLISENRTAEIVYARHTAMFLSRKYSLRSFAEIGRMFGDRDHSSVCHASKRIIRLMDEDWRVAHDVAHLERFLGVEN